MVGVQNSTVTKEISMVVPLEKENYHKIQLYPY